MHSLVDHRDRAHERARPVPDGHALPAVLQREDRLQQGRGKSPVSVSMPSPSYLFFGIVLPNRIHRIDHVGVLT